MSALRFLDCHGPVALAMTQWNQYTVPYPPPHTVIASRVAVRQSRVRLCCAPSLCAAYAKH